MRGCLRNMDNIIQLLIDEDKITREVIIALATKQGLMDGTIKDKEEGAHIMFWMTRLDLLDDIRARINDEELLTEDQKSYLWSIVLGGV